MSEEVKQNTTKNLEKETSGEPSAANQDPVIPQAANRSDNSTSMSTSTTTPPQTKKKKRKKKIIIFIIILLLIALAVFRIATSKKETVVEEVPPVNVKVSTVQMESLATTSPLSGRIEPVDEVSIVPLTSGKVVRVNVKVGDRVAAGSVLFEIDQTPFQASYNQALDAYNNAQLNAERTELLFHEGAASQQQYEQANSALVSAQTALTNTQDSLNHCIVTAPLGGYVTALDISVGSVASQAAPAMTIADTSQLEIKTNVSEYLISKIAVGDPVQISIKSLSDQPFKGSIKSISPAPASGNLTYPITISIGQTDKEIKAGMFAEVNIVADEKNKVLCVPTDAVILKAGKSMVAVIENDVPVFKEVTTGVDNGELTEIKSGLNANDTIIVQGQYYVKEGEKVTIVK